VPVRLLSEGCSLLKNVSPIAILRGNLLAYVFESLDLHRSKVRRLTQCARGSIKLVL